MAKPVSKPDWTVGNPDFATVTQEPTAQKKEDGWFPDERPPREFINWLFFNINAWITYFDEQVDLFVNQSIIYDAYVGAGGSHADINALMADGDIANIKNVLVVSAIAIDNPQVINQDGMNFDFKAGAGFTKNGPTGSITGIQIDSDRVRINQGRFVGFSTAGDKGIINNGTNNMVMGCQFNTNNTAIDDTSGTNTVLVGNMEEI